MPKDMIPVYDVLAAGKRLRGMLRNSLLGSLKTGLPGEHPFFFITFSTTATGVRDFHRPQSFNTLEEIWTIVGCSTILGSHREVSQRLRIGCPSMPSQNACMWPLRHFKAVLLIVSATFGPSVDPKWPQIGR